MSTSAASGGDPARRRLETLSAAALRAAEQVHPAPLWRDVARLHELFTHDRAERASGYLREPPLRRAYLGYFAPLNAAKVSQVLLGLVAEGRWRAPKAPRVLDLGAGPLSGLAGSWVAHGALGDCVAVDLATRAMEDGRAWLERAGAENAGLTLVTRNVLGPALSSLGGLGGASGFDLVLACNVLNEVGDPRRDLERRTQLVEAALSCLSPGGRVLILEPGTRVHGRALQRLRDELVDRRMAQVIAPCMGTLPCPLLARAADWCHHESAWEPLPRVRELEQRAGLAKRVLHYSYLWLARADDAWGDALPQGEVRLVGGTMRSAREGGRARRYGCGTEGLVVLENPRGPLAPQVQHALRGRAVAATGPGYQCAPLPLPAFSSPKRARASSAPVVAAEPTRAPHSAGEGGMRPPRSKSRKGRGARES